ncbi:MAG: ABC transporter ATP-binding protein [Candidatus Nealsonbacteria bacterium]|nr:ABC transporter ATP-binding protein [Candidatus Nealsonbacteria bacterium]
METILKVNNLTKKYDGFTAVSNVSFEVKEGEIVGLLGPNGAGKTTTIHMLLSLLEPTSGKIEIFGKDLFKNRENILSRVNFVAPYSPLPYNLTPYENLTVFSFLYAVKNRKNRVESLLEEFQLQKFRNSRTGSLSAGEQTRLSIAKAFINDPRLLLLDEPTVHLDPLIAREIREKIYYKMRVIKGGVLWTSHNMKEIETMCDKIIFLFNGKIFAEDSPENLKRSFGKEDLEEVFIHLSKEAEKQTYDD